MGCHCIAITRRIWPCHRRVLAAFAADTDVDRPGREYRPCRSSGYRHCLGRNDSGSGNSDRNQSLQPSNHLARPDACPGRFEPAIRPRKRCRNTVFGSTCIRHRIRRFLVDVHRACDATCEPCINGPGNGHCDDRRVPGDNMCHPNWRADQRFNRLALCVLHVGRHRRSGAGGAGGDYSLAAADGSDRPFHVPRCPASPCNQTIPLCDLLHRQWALCGLYLCTSIPGTGDRVGRWQLVYCIPPARSHGFSWQFRWRGSRSKECAIGNCHRGSHDMRHDVSVSRFRHRSVGCNDLRRRVGLGVR